MMTLDEAIKHIEKLREEQYELYSFCPVSDMQLCDGRSDCTCTKNPVKGCLKYVGEYMQLAKWLEELKQLREQTKWIPADANNLPKGEVIYKLHDGRMGVGVLFTYEFFYDDRLTVCVKDNYGEHPDVIEWAPLPYQPEESE